MPSSYPTTRDFVSALSARGELRNISARVSPCLEIAAAADLAAKSPSPRSASPSAQSTDPRFHNLGGPALLFDNVEGADFPVLINAWGSYSRMELALGSSFQALADRIANLVKPEPPRSLAEALAKARQFLPLLRIPPKRRRGLGLCQQVIIPQDRVDLTRIPIIKCWPLDGDFASLGYSSTINDNIPGLGSGPDWNARHRGKYITLAGIHTVHADDRDNPKPPSHNIGMYRAQLLGPRTLAMHWHMHHDGARHWRSWKKLGQPMPVAIALGGESVMPYAATAPLPPGISELLLAGFLNGSGIPLVRARTVPLWVPANAEFIIEGYVSTDAGFIDFDPKLRPHEPLGPGAVFEGPFGDHTGFYSLPDRYPILSVSAVTHRRDPIYPTTVVGLPIQEDYFLGKATERIFLPLLKTLIHDIEDYDLPIFGTFHNCAAIKIKKAYPLQGRRVMHSVWGAGQMAWTKSIFVVDDSVNVHDHPAVLRAAADFCHPLRDIETVIGPLDILDHAAPRLGAGMKIGFDCTRKIANEDLHGVPIASPSASPPPLLPGTAIDALRALPHVLSVTFADSASHGWLFVRMHKTAPQQGRELLQIIFDSLAETAPASRHPAFILALPEEARADSVDDQLFHWLAHADASRDMLRWSRPDGSVHRVGFDATRKLPGDEFHHQPVRDWPPLLSVPEAITARARELLASSQGSAGLKPT
jgi:4-hydroxy-3-polyprenylbenzoate decarboxylase